MVADARRYSRKLTKKKGEKAVSISESVHAAEENEKSIYPYIYTFVFIFFALYNTTHLSDAAERKQAAAKINVVLQLHVAVVFC